MVGVPGRSKACSTCRKRKKRCDLKQPTCGVCAKSKLICGGYQREMIIVQVREGKGIYKPATQTQHQPVMSMASISDLRTRDLNRVSLETKFYTTFWDLYIPKDEFLSKWGLGWGLGSSSENSIARLSHPTTHKGPNSDTLRCALLALCVAKIGRADQDRIMVQRGLELYRKALDKVTAQIAWQGAFDTTDMIVTCRLLALYEQLNDGTTSNWHGHVDGLLKIVKTIPPESYALRPKHDIFLEARSDGAVAALVNRKGTFLSSPEWMTKPFQGKCKTAVDNITDILLQLATTLEEFDILVVSEQSPQTKSRVDLFKAGCWKLDEQLQAWYRDSLSAFTTSYAHDTSSEDIDTAAREKIPDILARYGLAALFAMVQYWAARVILSSSMHVFYRMFPSSHVEIAGELLSPRMDIKMNSLSIGRSIKHFVKPNLGLAATLSIILPISCITQMVYLQNLAYSHQEHCPMFREIQSVLQDVSDATGGVWTSPSFDAMFRQLLELVVESRVAKESVSNIISGQIQRPPSILVDIVRSELST
ncbi:hypothetical protein K504DRAFT_497737 [Pleomassaria siparia CBS 279.74]|uniref:Zn(2)-C6 fungal-type domain-containing protein n=1 Tax=Pleomassaria siparia CBS 279.74 TaxID=1314801 RepID=A0A6G1KKI4_9PLEO|nr:hypothetical protein K504DRAFT_497737 [Pleomassaria siparia CBS 279.74]